MTLENLTEVGLKGNREQCVEVFESTRGKQVEK